MASQKKRKTNAPQAVESKEPQGRLAARRRLRWLVAIVLLAVLVWFLPVILVNSPLLAWGVRTASADLDGSVAVESVSASWLSPISVRGINVRDSQGKSVLAVSSVVGDRSLAAILLNYKKLGCFRIESPTLQVVLREDGSNVEDLLAKYLQPKTPGPTPASPSAASTIGLSIEIVNGTIALSDPAGTETRQIQNLNVGLDMSSGIGKLTGVTVKAELPDATRPGSLTADWSVNAAASPESAVNEVVVTAKEIPLGLFRPFLTRLVPKMQLAGQLNCTAKTSWSSAKDSKIGIQTELNVEGFSLAASALQSDVLRLDRLHGGGQVNWQSDRLEIVNSSLDCDFCSVVASSVVPLGGKSGLSFEAIVRERHDVRGQIDLARLARLLPATFHLRQDLQVQSGQIQWVLSSQPNPQGIQWQGQFEASPLKAVRQGQPLAWPKPIAVRFTAEQVGQQAIAGEFACESEFLKIHGAGSRDNLAVSATFNLRQLTEPLGQFVDLSGVTFNGDGDGSLNWKRAELGTFEADAGIRLQNLQVVLPDHLPLQEPQLQMYAEAKGYTDFGEKTQIDSADLKVATAADLLDVQVARPQTDPNDDSWSVMAQMKGKLQSWPARLGVWFPMKDWRMAGDYVLVAQGKGAKEGVEVRQASLSVAPLNVASPVITLNEPKLEVAAVGAWNEKQRRLQMPNASLNCSALAVQANNVIVALPEQGATEISGSLKYQGALDRLRAWFCDQANPSAWQLAGQLNGATQFTQTAGQIRGENTIEIANLSVNDSTGGQFQEPSMRLDARGCYDTKNNMLQLEQCELRSSIVAANVAGRTAPVQGQQVAQFDGQVNYDLDRLTGLLRPYLGTNVHMAGRGTSQVYYRGPFSLPACESGTSVRWDSAEFYGFDAGPGELKGAVSKGVLQVEPLTLAVSQGQLRLTPQLRFSPEPIELILPAGPLVEHVALSPAMCSGWMKYLAPAIADVATAKGSFSIALEKCRIPLNEPSKGDVIGKLTVHTADVSAGPILRSLATFLGRESPASLRSQSVVPFRMADGRVYHENLELIFPELTIRTSGWVGFDQTMSIRADMPVPPKWLDNNPLAETLRTQMISVPIAGTLSKPQVDQRVAEQLAKQFVRQAAQNAVANEVDKQLNRLFGPRK